MSSVELFDELEAGELAIQFEGEEPEALLAWAIEEFGDRLAISTSFQADSVALIDMAYNIDSSIKVFSIDTGRLPAESRFDRDDVTGDIVLSVRPGAKGWPGLSRIGCPTFMTQ